MAVLARDIALVPMYVGRLLFCHVYFPFSHILLFWLRLCKVEATRVYQSGGFRGALMGAPKGCQPTEIWPQGGTNYVPGTRERSPSGPLAVKPYSSSVYWCVGRDSRRLNSCQRSISARASAVRSMPRKSYSFWISASGCSRCPQTTCPGSGRRAGVAQSASWHACPWPTSRTSAADRRLVGRIREMTAQRVHHAAVGRHQLQRVAVRLQHLHVGEGLEQRRGKMDVVRCLQHPALGLQAARFFCHCRNCSSRFR